MKLIGVKIGESGHQNHFLTAVAKVAEKSWFVPYRFRLAEPSTSGWALCSYIIGPSHLNETGSIIIRRR